MNVHRDNLRAGLFLLLGALGLVAAILVLADLPSFFEPQQQIRVIYRLSDGLQGLRPGAALTLGGQPVGRVTAITDVCAPADDPQRVVAKLVTLELPERYRLYDNAEIELVVPTLGAGTSLNVRSVGSGTPLRSDQPLQGAVAGSLLTASLLRDAGVDDEQRQQIRQIISNVCNLSAALSRDVPQMTASLNAILEDARPLLHDCQQVLAQLKQATASVNQILGEVTDHSDQWVKNLDATSAAVASAASRLDAILASGQPLVARTLASLETTAAQLKLASIEIRRSPWRLLYRPTDRELETENLYDSARSFALAADSLDSAAQSLSALRQATTADPADLEQMLDHLRQLFGRFQQAEQQFWQSLDQQAAAQK